MHKVEVDTARNPYRHAGQVEAIMDDLEFISFGCAARVDSPLPSTGHSGIVG
jgi:hypothetical protein